VLFSSPIFLFLFLPVVLAVYFCQPNLRLRNFWLLLASVILYAWGEPAFVALRPIINPNRPCSEMHQD
jgi:alginate O-acetyltransferase complex protein AlgI